MKYKFKEYSKYLKISKWYLLLQLLLAFVSGGGCIALTVCINYAMKGIEETNFGYVSLICGLMVGSYLLNSLVNYLQYSINVFMSQKIAFYMRANLLNKLNNFKMKFFDNNEAGNILSKFTIDLNNVTTFISEFIADFIGVFVWIVGLTMAIFIISWKLALITFGIFLIFFFILCVIIKKSNPYFQKTQKQLTSMNSFLNQSLSNSESINSCNLNSAFIFNFSKQSNLLQKTNTKSYFMGTFSFIYMEFVINFMVILMTFIGIIFINNNISLGGVPFVGGAFDNSEFTRLTIFILLMRQFLSPFNLSSSYILFTMTAFASYKRIEKLYDDNNYYSKLEKTIIGNCQSLAEQRNNSIEFRNVYFGYLKNSNVINNLCFEIKKNSFVGIVGETGSGKSTIINLITKLYSLNSGDVFIDDISINNYSEQEIREKIFVIPQDTHIFKDTIYNNIKLNNNNITNDDIDQLINKLGMNFIFDKFSKKLDTIIDNNSEISYGEKQLISICRALVSKSNIVVLDEINSSMDIELENILNDAINYLKKTKTLIFIAHKLSAIKDANKIIVLKNGELVEMGNHNELIDKKGYYYDLWNI